MAQPAARNADGHGFSKGDLRAALGKFATGVTVITTAGVDEPYGMTANAFTSVSLDPPLVLVCIINGTRGCEAIARNGVFAVNVLTAEQEAISRYFASRDRPSGSAAFKDIAHGTGVTGAPVLDDVAAHLDCRVVAQHVAGDHTIYIGEVLNLEITPETPPLVFHAGRYCGLATEER